MKQEDALKEKYGQDSGMRVPEGYFATLQGQIMESLPPYEKARPMLERSRWQRMKPYVYLAAMFCGIWLMMKVFHGVTQPMYSTLDNPPAALVQLLDSEDDDLRDSYYVSDYDMEEEVIMSYDSIEEFEKDFGYSLLPEYASAKITVGNDKKV